MNLRQLRLKNMIDLGQIPKVIDATGIWDKDENKIPFHWGDLEVIGYGTTTRYYDEQNDQMLLTRHYNGPGKIVLHPGHIMVKGDYKED